MIYLVKSNPRSSVHVKSSSSMMNDILRIARLKIALQRAFLGRAILIFTNMNISINKYDHRKTKFVLASENKVQMSAHGLCLLLYRGRYWVLCLG